MIVRKIAIIVCLIGISSCHPNMSRKPSRWVTVIDATTNKPVPNVDLVYRRTSGIITGNVYTSIPYTSGVDGRAFVPSGVMLYTAHGSDYTIDFDQFNGMVDEMFTKPNIYITKKSLMKHRPPNDAAYPSINAQQEAMK